MSADDIVTARLRLRPWRADDRAPFAALNADPEVMRHFPATLDRSFSDALAARLAAHVDQHGWGMWALEGPDGRFLGFCGVAPVTFTAPFTPALELAFRLARDAWGHGYATEAARAALDATFARVGVDQVVAFTTPGNARSRAVLERLGMSHDPDDDFDHPRLAARHPLRRHVLYRAHRP